MSILNSLKRNPALPGPEHVPAPKPALPTLPRFLTLGGAEVIVKNNPANQYWAYAWECLGCGLDGESSDAYDAGYAANKHAGACRAMPKPDEA